MTREKKRNKDRADKTPLLIDHRIFLNMLLQITSLEAKQILEDYTSVPLRLAACSLVKIILTSLASSSRLNLSSSLIIELKNASQ